MVQISISRPAGCELYKGNPGIKAHGTKSNQKWHPAIVERNVCNLELLKHQNKWKG